MLAELIQIREDLSGLKDGSLTNAVKELQHLSGLLNYQETAWYTV